MSGYIITTLVTTRPALTRYRRRRCRHGAIHCYHAAGPSSKQSPRQPPLLQACGACVASRRANHRDGSLPRAASCPSPHGCARQQPAPPPPPPPVHRRQRRRRRRRRQRNHRLRRRSLCLCLCLLHRRRCRRRRRSLCFCLRHRRRRRSALAGARASSHAARHWRSAPCSRAACRHSARPRLWPLAVRCASRTIRQHPWQARRGCSARRQILRDRQALTPRSLRRTVRTMTSPLRCCGGTVGCCLRQVARRRRRQGRFSRGSEPMVDFASA